MLLRTLQPREDGMQRWVGSDTMFGALVGRTARLRPLGMIPNGVRPIQPMVLRDAHQKNVGVQNRPAAIDGE
jgi:hypothetical protein